jgi:hypothetical protein
MLKTPYRDGTTHVIFEPEDLIAQLAIGHRMPMGPHLGATPQGMARWRRSCDR